jgi:hypothetical protein
MLGCLSFYSLAFAQPFISENDHLIGWTKDAQIHFSDFKGKPSQQIKKLHKDYGIQASVVVGLKSVLDIPKRKRDQGRLLENVYVAPFFFKFSSVTLTTDTAALAKQRLYFDLAELAARMMRERIAVLQQEEPSFGTLWIHYASIRNWACSTLKEMMDQYTVEVLVDKREGALEEWKAWIREELADLQVYETKKQDCHRLLTDKPVDSAYAPAKHLIGVFTACE